MPSKAINNDDDNNDLTSNSKKEKQPLVKNKQSEEQLQIGQDFETEVLEEKNDEIMFSLTPSKQMLDEQLSKAKRKKKTKEKKKRLVKHSSKLAETQLTSDLKRELAKQASNVNQITKILKPLQKYTIMTERQFKSIKQIEIQIKQLQKQTFDILKAIRKIK